jgi:hypothetical protein
MLQNRLMVLRRLGYYQAAETLEAQIYALGEDVGRKDAYFETLIEQPRVLLERLETPRGTLEVVAVSGIVDTGVRARGKWVAKYHLIAGVKEQQFEIMRQVFGVKV